MLHIQRSLFESESRFGATQYIAGGCYSHVWAHPDGQSVIKRGSFDDGTMFYLIWCYEYQRATGKPMKGMPEIYSMALCEGENTGYVATMKRYVEAEYQYEEAGIRSYKRGSCLPYMDTLINMWADVSEYATGEALIGDMHSGNFLWDADKQELIMTDPSGYSGCDRSAIRRLRDSICASAESFSLTLQ